MFIWKTEKTKAVMKKTKTAIMEELKILLDEEMHCDCANYWLDSAHNIFAIVVYGRMLAPYIDVYVELHDNTKEDQSLIGDLSVYRTDDVTLESLERVIDEIIKAYYAE